MPTPDEVTAALANWRAWQQHHTDDVWRFSNGNPARSMEASMTLADDYPRLQAERDRLRAVLQKIWLLTPFDSPERLEAVAALGVQP